LKTNQGIDLFSGGNITSILAMIQKVLKKI
jgi:hypothetical protein